MRSLAAKYNNTNPNEYVLLSEDIICNLLNITLWIHCSASSARNLFFDHQKYTSGPTKSASKESPSPPEIKRSSLATPPQVPFVPPLFPGLPFSPTVFPPLIDMSSTQALVTLVSWYYLLSFISCFTRTWGNFIILRQFRSASSIFIKRKNPTTTTN